VGQSSQVKTVTLTAVQAGTSVTSVTSTGANAADFVVGPASTCIGAANLALDATCQVRVTFTPTAVGARAAVLRIVPATGSPVLVNLTATADVPAAPVASVTPGVLAYGTVTAPNSSTLTTTVRNTGNAPLIVGNPTLTGTGAADYAVSASTCGNPVAPAGTCTISVRFTPTVTGSRVASLTIPHNAAGGQTVVSLTATGAGSTFSLSPNPVTFGTVNRNTTKAQTISVRNTGTIAFTVGAGTFTGANATLFTFTGTGCSGTVLAAGKSCNVTVTVRPTAVGAFTAALNLAGDATSLPASVSTSLTGSGK